MVTKKASAGASEAKGGDGEGGDTQASTSSMVAEDEGDTSIRSIDNFSVALDNISTQLKPLFDIPWSTLISR